MYVPCELILMEEDNAYLPYGRVKTVDPSDCVGMLYIAFLFS